MNSDTNDATITDGKAAPKNGAVVFTVEQSGDYLRFYNETYGYLYSNGTGNNAFYKFILIPSSGTLRAH